MNLPQRYRVALALLPFSFAIVACSREKASAPAGGKEAAAPSISPAARAAVQLGSEIFLRTQAFSQPLGGNALACTNCHLDGGKQVGGLALVGSSRRYPWKGPDGRSFTLEDRIVRCLTQSLNAQAPAPGRKEIAALAAYIAWLGEGLPPGQPPAWLTAKTIAAQNIVPIGQLDAVRGRQKYVQYCSGCHGRDGQGYSEKRPPLPYESVPPLWGPRSYNDVSGLARVYTLAGFARHAMPLDKPGDITDQDVQEIAAYVDGQPRPASANKDAWDGSSPEDAVYDTRRYPKNPFRAPDTR
ncbi:MAG TPA: c-type cytochrome [Thermoanaerobaculia bacterium]|nr:c-type cytochrome [Thermoanaerobaculia bacterium]